MSEDKPPQCILPSGVCQRAITALGLIESKLVDGDIAAAQFLCRIEKESFQDIRDKCRARGK